MATVYDLDIKIAEAEYQKDLVNPEIAGPRERPRFNLKAALHNLVERLP